MESAVRGARMGGGGGGGGGTGAEALPLPPPPRLTAMSASSPASIRALLARTASGGGGGGVDCQSPRSLLSRILQRGDGGSGGGFGCRVRLPRRYGSSSGGGGTEERKDGAAEQAGDTAMVKLVERAPELPVETPRSSLGKKKPEEEVMSMNLGLGASLVLLLSKSAVELNKMVELRAQMEALVSEIRQETQGKEKNSAPASSSSSSSSQESNGSTTTVIKDPIVRATSEDALSNCFGRTEPDNRRAVVVMDQMEAELQVELSRLQIQQRTAHGEKRVAPMQMQGLELPLLQVKTKSVVSNSPSRSCVDDDGVVVESGNAEEEVDDSEEEEEEEEEYEKPEHDDDDDDDDDEEEEHEVVDRRSPPHGGVSARALERRLHELLQRRQQERIVELESALDSVQRRLQEREREVVWWRDAAKLVSHRRDESRRLR